MNNKELKNLFIEYEKLLMKASKIAIDYCGADTSFTAGYFCFEDYLDTPSVKGDYLYNITVWGNYWCCGEYCENGYDFPMAWLSMSDEEVEKAYEEQERQKEIEREQEEQRRKEEAKKLAELEAQRVEAYERAELLRLKAKYEENDWSDKDD